MSSAESPEASGADPLQFDHAEFTTGAPPSVSCRACGQPIADAYYEINGSILCDRCRQGVLARFQRRSGGFYRFTKALVFGTGGALAGAAITYAVFAITHWTIGLISVLSGYLIGKGISKGSDLRGGLHYQLLAVALTYSSIAWSFVPIFMSNVNERLIVKENGGRPDGEKAPRIRGEDAGAAEPAVEQRARGPVAPGDPVARFVTAFAISLIGGYAMPLVLARNGELLSLLIYFFGLQAAWRMTRKINLSINGPFRVGGNVPPPQGVSAHG